jgi:hypothetical protein
MEWPEVLDLLEARIAAQRTALDAGDAGEVGPFEPPAGLGPLPPALGRRAMAILDDAQDLMDELAGNVAGLAQDLAVVRRVDAANGPRPAAKFFDRSV